uniref:Uncharacterized protein n=1 Tax=Calcidiscus leptoporus TaxID=127549 RepID=A0A7S0JD12_9EUKA
MTPRISLKTGDDLLTRTGIAAPRGREDEPRTRVAEHVRERLKALIWKDLVQHTIAEGQQHAVNVEEDDAGPFTHFWHRATLSAHALAVPCHATVPPSFADWHGSGRERRL